MRRITAIRLAILLAASLAVPAVAQNKPTKIGFIDLKRVYEESGKKEEYDARMVELRREKDSVLLEMKEKILAMEKIKAELSEEKRREKEDEIRRLRADFDNFSKDARDDLRRKMAEFEREFARELKEVVTEIGDKEGYTYILSDIVVLYSQPDLDLTDKAIAALKKNDKKSEKSSSKGN